MANGNNNGAWKLVASIISTAAILIGVLWAVFGPRTEAIASEAARNEADRVRVELLDHDREMEKRIEKRLDKIDSRLDEILRRLPPE